MLRIGRVYCNQQEELCSRFGVSMDAAGDGPGLPYMTWFKKGEEAGPYEGERTLAGVQAWVAAKQAEGAM